MQMQNDIMHQFHKKGRAYAFQSCYVKIVHTINHRIESENFNLYRLFFVANKKRKLY